MAETQEFGTTERLQRRVNDLEGKLAEYQAMMLKDGRFAGEQQLKIAELETRIARLREQALDGVLLELAHDNVGIYPMSIVGGPKSYEKRTEKMEGWNECGLEHAKLACRARRFIEAVPVEHRARVEDQLIDGKIRLHLGETAELYVNCNDLFFWGCSDAETIALEDLEALAECLKLSPRHGELLWCCRKRGMRPQTAFFKCFDRAEWPLFAAAGPSRDDPDGKGTDALLAKEGDRAKD